MHVLQNKRSLHHRLFISSFLQRCTSLHTGQGVCLRPCWLLLRCHFPLHIFVTWLSNFVRGFMLCDRTIFIFSCLSGMACSQLVSMSLRQQVGHLKMSSQLMNVEMSKHDWHPVSGYACYVSFCPLYFLILSTMRLHIHILPLNVQAKSTKTCFKLRQCIDLTDKTRCFPSS